jgi:hypothetical protein
VQFVFSACCYRGRRFLPGELRLSLDLVFVLRWTDSCSFVICAPAKFYLLVFSSWIRTPGGAAQVSHGHGACLLGLVCLALICPSLLLPAALVFSRPLLSPVFSFCSRPQCPALFCCCCFLRECLRAATGYRTWRAPVCESVAASSAGFSCRA